MLRFLSIRAWNGLLVMLGVSFTSFLLFSYIGDPVNNLLGESATVAQKEALRASLGLDQPLLVRFYKYLGLAVRGEFGVSYRNLEPVGQLLWSRVPATLELSFCAAALALGAGIPMGVYAAIRRDSRIAQLMQLVSLIGISMPSFLTGILLILVFSVELNWLPASGRGDVVQWGPWSTGLLTLSGWKSLVMPSITLALFQLTLFMRLVRSEMLEVLRTDYIKFARARGIAERSIHFHHALKNTLIPVITVAGLQLGALIAFSIITETVFQWPGMGLLIIQAITFSDIPVIAAYLMLIALLFVGINAAVDLLYFRVDPRVRPA
ncbi:ABC transporter permease [Verminephrobacter aporrectodeae subsp. tuberculatae]|uniref:ABC transporter permease n=1 Tax=Verminephrobacter aporrectodeae subsp. tuberculatae TaxID=1110392 RepID=A0ABT3KNA2_9BURK|nr:ABC transporter permease [Verminephrobacter aporrectodeae]MCW5221202.1 ABC transporter permease [Verminephrobacter aporrectodeae subsp. tuberculatae]MCW5254961.1 ABC transporter permease [Verminephrobacter aporrectodeae subsp. tuberculatae]MCW5290493.1 ABC transporter permease [Verminephrobacter aporrectodeae subsp. tuberculatae]MCW5319793.1 ABC transporter permease [Verminephrobacter aporrectodeae subsp. tuberculatae]MCW8166562.1 ABC transporter permease [Verminephrobacter aporrectodeae su